MRYDAYDRSSQKFQTNPLMNSSITRRDDRLAPGVEVFGVAVNNHAWACPLEEIERQREIKIEVDGISVTVAWNKELKTPELGEPFGGFALRSYWYAWSQFYPHTELLE